MTTALAGALASGGCLGAGPLETATELPKTPRRPDGVVIEPPPALPVAGDRAPATGVVALREPLGDKDVEEVVRAYVRAFEREDIDALVQLLAQEAVPLGRFPAGKFVTDTACTTKKVKHFQTIYF